MRVNTINTVVYSKQKVNNIKYSNNRIINKNPSFGMIIMDPAPIPGFIIKIIAGLMKGKTNNTPALNQVVGNSALKSGLIQNILNPLKLAMDGYLHADKLIPNGICFFGPPGVGKTFITKSLMEQYHAMGGHIKELEFAGNDAINIANMRQIFTEAEQRFHESGNKKYTMIFLDSLENTAKRLDRENANEPRTKVLLDLVRNCKDRGIIFISNTLQPSKNCPELLQNGRTDLRVPIEFIQYYDMADFVSYYANKAGTNSDFIDYLKVINGFKQTGKLYKPKDIEYIVHNTVRKHESIDTAKLIKEIVSVEASDGDKVFESEKLVAKQLGGLNQNAMLENL